MRRQRGYKELDINAGRVSYTIHIHLDITDV